nr:helix-turn-helix domain-containing protein [Acidihalobacter yilgarnensis]
MAEIHSITCRHGRCACAPPLSDAVRISLEHYFQALDGHEPSDLYRLVLAEVERPLLEAVLIQCRGNQCRAASYLGISRGTLRKKLLDHGLN